MSSPVGHSGLGGLLLAVGRLRPSTETTHAIARLLNLVPDALEQAAPPPPRDPLEPAVALSEPLLPRPVERRIETRTQNPVPLPVSTDEEQPLRVVRRRGPGQVQTALSSPSPASSVSSTTRGVQIPELEPLLRPVATRAIVGTSLAQHSTAGGSIDVDRLVELVAQKRNVEAVPLRGRWSIAGHTLVLVDRGVGMTPFARDANELLERIRAVASRDRTQSHSFWGTPKRRQPSHPASEAFVPPSRTAVVALTDLGIAPGAPAGVVADWLEYAQVLRSTGSSLVIFVPYPAERWPAVAAALPLVSWDRPTTLAAVLATTRSRSSR